MTYRNNGKTYKVDEVNFGGAIINVNGTSITDDAKLQEVMHSHLKGSGYGVFVDGDEVAFKTFAEAYEFATTKQKDTVRL